MEKINKIVSKVKGEPYLIINVAFAFIIVGILVYSLIFSPDEGEYPVACVHELLTGESCVSCGLSHSFSLILRGRFDEALVWNVYGIRVFMFFAVQLVMRIFFSSIYTISFRNSRRLVITDAIISAVFLLYSFWPYLAYIFRLFISLRS